MKLNISVIAVAAVVSAASAFAQAPAIQPVMMKQLKPDVWVGLGGSGGNSTIYIGKTGVIVVDAKQTEAGAKDKAEQKLGDDLSAARHRRNGR